MTIETVKKSIISFQFENDSLNEIISVSANEWQKDSKHRLYINHAWSKGNGRGTKSRRPVSVGYFEIEKNEVVKFVEEDNRMNRYSSSVEQEIQDFCSNLIA